MTPRKPHLTFRLEIERVVTEFRWGIHRSILRGTGFDFQGLRSYDPSDPPNLIDWFASARVSDDPDFQLVSKIFSPEKEIKAVVLLDGGESMKIPPQKDMHVYCLLWLFALSAFKSHDRFRMIKFLPGAFIDSGWTGSEESLDDFLSGVAVSANEKEAAADIFSYVDKLELHDALVVLISDFCREWKDELASLSRLGMFERNIRMIFLALDEWSGFAPTPYATILYDPITRQDFICDLGSGSRFDELRKNAGKHLIRIAKVIHPLLIPLVKVPLVSDPLDAAVKGLWKEGFE